MEPFVVGTLAYYTCNPGYELTGPGDKMRICVNNGDGSGPSFNGIAPTCRRKICYYLSKYNRALSNVYIGHWGCICISSLN